MRVSIVTTTLNALPFIAETTRSVLQSTHSDLEYLVIDAGSTDGTLEYLRGLRDKRVRVELRKGDGQYEAIDWGFKHSSGEILAWLNGDDIYFPWTISCVARLFSEFPEVKWLTGLPTFANPEGHCTMVGSLTSYPKRYIQNGWFSEYAFGNLVQESMFWHRDLYEKAGGLDLTFKHAADFELWTRFARYACLEAVGVPLAAWRKHSNNRSITGLSAYLKDVVSATAALPPLGAIKAGLCRHKATKHALRLLEWHRTPWIYYSLVDSEWKRGTAVRPISRYSLQYLKMEFLAAKREKALAADQRVIER